MTQRRLNSHNVTYRDKVPAASRLEVQLYLRTNHPGACGTIVPQALQRVPVVPGFWHDGDSLKGQVQLYLTPFDHTENS